MAIFRGSFVDFADLSTGFSFIFVMGSCFRPIANHLKLEIRLNGLPLNSLIKLARFFMLSFVSCYHKILHSALFNL